MHIQRNWLWRLGLMVGALLVLWLLAASLSTPTLRSGWTELDFWRGAPGGSQLNPNLLFGKIVIAASLILVLTLLVVNTLLASRRKRPLAKTNFSLISVMLMLLVIAILRPDVLERLRLTPPAAAPSAAATAPATNAPAVPAALPDVLVYGVSLAAAGLVVFLAWTVWQAVRRRRPQAQASVAQQAAQMAHLALADWQSGSPLADVIIRCYREMSELVAEKRAVQRADDMTPREFVQRLEKAGVPAQPVQQLTALFELARYSPQPLGASEEVAARACLQALAEALETPA
jgi:hypothetical protein